MVHICRGPADIFSNSILVLCIVIDIFSSLSLDFRRVIFPLLLARNPVFNITYGFQEASCNSPLDNELQSR